MSTLAELTAQYLAASDEHVDTDTGEVTVPDAATLDAIEASIGDKAEAIAAVLMRQAADERACKDLARHYTERAVTIKRASDRLRDWLLTCLDTAGLERVRGATATVSVRQTAAVVVLDADAVPVEYVVEKVTRAPDKRALKAALDSGATIAGVALEHRKHLQVR